MRNKLLLIIGLLFLISCGVFKKAAIKYWTENQVNEFMTNCEVNAKKILSAEKAKSYCKCAANTVAKEYHDYSEMKKIPIREVMKIAEGCR